MQSTHQDSAIQPETFPTPTAPAFCECQCKKQGCIARSSLRLKVRPAASEENSAIKTMLEQFEARMSKMMLEHEARFERIIQARLADAPDGEGIEHKSGANCGGQLHEVAPSTDLRLERLRAREITPKTAFPTMKFPSLSPTVSQPLNISWHGNWAPGHGVGAPKPIEKHYDDEDYSGVQALRLSVRDKKYDANGTFNHVSMGGGGLNLTDPFASAMQNGTLNGQKTTFFSTDPFRFVPGRLREA